MSSRPGRRPKDAKPIKDEWIDPPVLTLVNGPYCLMMAQRTAKDPDDPTREYKWNHFNVIRVENGLIKEHWDDFIIN
jgi:predicted SnoaL-like aldol condensation-catalyzing enzyme